MVVGRRTVELQAKIPHRSNAWALVPVHPRYLTELTTVDGDIHCVQRTSTTNK